MLGKKVQSSVPQMMRLLRAHVVANLDHEVTFEQVRMLKLISEGHHQKAMADFMQVTPAAISKMADSLVTKGFVSRKTGEDRRCQILELTPVGKKYLNKVMRSVEGKINDCIINLSLTEKKQLDQGLTVLDKLTSMMKEAKMYLLFLLPLLATGHAEAVITLQDAFNSARTNMETLKRADATIEQREEQRTRARGTILPTIAGVGTYTTIDRPEAPGGGTSPFLLTRQYSYALRVIQPLLRGGTLATLDLTRENILLAEFQKNSSELTLYQLVVNSYYNLIASRLDQANLLELKRLSEERVRELRGRSSIGRSRRGELVEAEAQLLTSDSQVQQGVISLGQAEQNFEFFTKIKPSELAPLSDPPYVEGTLQNYLNKMRSRPDILASQQQIRVAEKQIEVAKGGHYPSLDFTGNYYFKRTGVLATSDWDAGLAMSIPLFQGGTVQASVREAVEERRIAELNTSETTRAAERDHLGRFFLPDRDL
jgi:outer membrane protein